MYSPSLTLVYFFYGLAFFSMGLSIALEAGRSSDPDTRLAFRLLAAFGLVHGGHEWLEMFAGRGWLPGQGQASEVWSAIGVAILAVSFFFLSGSGHTLMRRPRPEQVRPRLRGPVVQMALWALGLFILWRLFPQDRWDVADVWTRYILAIPSALIISVGLIRLGRSSDQAGLYPFGRESLIAALAFAVYGLVGQLFTRPSSLPPSTVINSELFLQSFGFPVQVLRAAAALVIAVSMMRFLRTFEIKTKRRIEDLQAARLEEAQRREALRGELYQRVVAAQEAERGRIARELHDETGQALTALGMGLRSAAMSLHHDVEKTALRLRQLEGLAAQSLTELQRLVADLRPSHLDDLGLSPAIRWYAGEVGTRSGLQVEVMIEGVDRSLPQPLYTALFRVCQEALTNVVKHARASQARVLLRYGEAGLYLRIEDDGQGFDVDAHDRDASSGWGLRGIQERVALFGGNLSLHSHPGMGTVLEVEVPYLGDSGEESESQATSEV